MKDSEPEVGRIGKNVIYIKDADGHYSSYTITEKTTKEQLLEWGRKRKVDLSNYL